MDYYGFRKKVDRIREIDYRKMSEREYYTKIMRVLRSFGEHTDIDSIDGEILAYALKESGGGILGKDYMKWRESYEGKTGKKIKFCEDFGKACEKGEMFVAASYIHEILREPECASEILSEMNEGGRNESYAGTWIKASEKIIEREKKEKELAMLMEKEEQVKKKKNKSKEDIVEV